VLNSNGNWLSGWMSHTWMVVALSAFSPERSRVAGLPDGLGLWRSLRAAGGAGEAGVGKTALLDDTLAAAAAAGMQTARLTGVEAETQLGYAGCTSSCGHARAGPVVHRRSSARTCASWVRDARPAFRKTFRRW
jgi:hypothetical protein